MQLMLKSVFSFAQTINCITNKLSLLCAISSTNKFFFRGRGYIQNIPLHIPKNFNLLCILMHRNQTFSGVITLSPYIHHCVQLLVLAAIIVGQKSTFKQYYQSYFSKIYFLLFDFSPRWGEGIYLYRQYTYSIFIPVYKILMYLNLKIKENILQYSKKKTCLGEIADLCFIYFMYYRDSNILEVFRTESFIFIRK